MEGELVERDGSRESSVCISREFLVRVKESIWRKR